MYSMPKFEGAKPKHKTSSASAKPKHRRSANYAKFMEGFGSEITGGINGCEAMMNSFQREYNRWYLGRQRTILELRELKDKVHEDQLGFNSTNLQLKTINVESRRNKTDDGSSVDFIASMAALFTDIAGGITSVVQAVNIDKYMETFNEIIENDIKNTKPIRVARSNCIAEYRNVENIIRRYHSDTFGSALNKISKCLRVEDMCLDLKSIHGGDSIAEVFQKVDVFFQQLSRVQALSEVCNTIASYVDNNPAVLDACESAGKALYGIYEACNSEKKNNSLARRNVRSAANGALIRWGESDIGKLRRLVDDEEMCQAKLEDNICTAITDLEMELEEMQELYGGTRNCFC